MLATSCVAALGESQININNLVLHFLVLKLRQNMVCYRHRHQRFAIISFFILLISSSSHYTFFFTAAQGRKLAQTVAEGPKTSMKEDKTVVLWRSHIGSRPPRCERRCVSCTRCEAIQVPTNPQTSGAAAVTHHNSSPVSAAARGDDDDSSNYKPLSWKCKCGNFIYNP